MAEADNRVVELWEKGHRALLRERRDYWLNLAFYRDEQWVWWDRTREAVQIAPERSNDNDRVRLQINRIQPNLVTLMAKLLKRTLAFEVLPTAADDSTIHGARLGEAVLESSRMEGDWEDVREQVLLDTFLGGTAAVAIDWDPNGGLELARDPGTGKVTNTGDVTLTPLSIVEFALEPGVKRYTDARWWCRATTLPPEAAKDYYGLKSTPQADSSSHFSPLQRHLLAQRGPDDNTELVVCYTLYEKPTGDQKGKVTHVVGGETVAEEPWPFPWEDGLNVVCFRQQKLPMTWTGNTLLNASRPIQAAYNHARSNMAEHMKLAGNARLMVPDTTIDIVDDLTDEAGEIVPYDATAGMPGYLNPPNLPRWLIQEADRLKEELDDIMSVHDISRGIAPGQDASGIALSLMAEKDDTPLGLMAKDQSSGWGTIGRRVLELYASKVEEMRTSRIDSGQGVPVTLEWNGKMLRGQTGVRVPLDNVMPHSRVALQAWVTNLVDRGMVPKNPQLVAKLIDLPGQDALMEAIDADAARAQRENNLLQIGHAQVPETFDNHATHIAEHNRHRKSAAYQYAPEDVRLMIDQHIKAHEVMAMEEAARQLALNTAEPGLGGVPQADEPAGSMVPPDMAERQEQDAGQGAPGAPGGMA